MAKIAKAANSGAGHHATGHHAIGKVAILYGHVQAVSADGTIHILTPNSLVFADDKIITESDGSVSIILDGTPPIHLDLGRMSQIVLDEDVYGGVGAGTTADATAEADKIQQALLAGDQPINPEAPAAGGVADAGGGHPIVHYSLTGEEVTPTSGAETIGLQFGPLGVIPAAGINNGVEILDLTPAIDGGDARIDEGGLTNGNDPGSPTTVAGDFRVNAPDGLDDVFIGDKLIIHHGALVDAGPFDTPLGNHLAITGYDPGTGVITYSYTLEVNEIHPQDAGENSIFEEFQVVASDVDGSTAVGTLSINIVDDIPELKTEGGSDTVLVGDEEMHGGVDIDWGPNKSLSDHAAGDIKDNVNWGADGFGSVTGFDVGAKHFDAGATVYWDQHGNFLETSSTGAAAELMVNADGTYTFHLLQNMLLGQGVQGEQTDTLAMVSIVGQDGDGDPQAVNVTLNVQDDIPLCLTAPEFAIVSEEELPGGNDDGHGWFDFPVQVDGTIVDNAWWGADGFGGTTGFDVDQQHFDADTTVYWDQQGKFLGTEGGDGAAAELQVNDDGTYNFTLLKNILISGPGEQIDLLDKVTITGQDGDGDTASVDLYLKVQDDVPCINVCAEDEANTLLTTHDALTIGAAFDVATSAANFGSVFAVTSSYGADGPGSETMSYSLKLDHGTKLNSGLDSQGHDIYLYKIGSDIVGSTSTSQSGVTGANTVFAMAVNGSGVVTLTQYQEIDHANNNDTSAPYDDQYAVLGSNLVKLSAMATITDGDGDKATDSATIDLGGNIRFADDGPSVQANVIVFMDDEAANHPYGTPNPGGLDDQSPDEVNATGTLSHNYGADIPGTTLLTGATLPVSGGFSSAVTNGGTTLMISQMQDGHKVDVLKVILSDTTDGHYTVDQLHPVFHPTPGVSEENVMFTVNYQVTDYDHDAAFGSLIISVNDDTPTARDDHNTATVGDDGGCQDSLSCIVVGPEEEGNFAHGNVMDNDTEGADGARVSAISYIGIDGNEHTEIIGEGKDDTVTVDTKLGELTIDDEGNYCYKANSIDSDHDTITVDINNTNLGTGISASGLVTITVEGHDHSAATLINNDNAFGVASDDGGNGGRYDEINYLGGGKSEVMKFELQDGKVAHSAEVNFTEFYSNEGGVGNERGAYELWLDDVKVQNATMFEAASKDGKFTLDINGPAGGFDEIRFTSLAGSNPTPGADDSSDYSIKGITFDVTCEQQHTDKFTYTLTDGDLDTSSANLTIDITTLVDDHHEC